jgi:hydrogenase maturation protease
MTDVREGLERILEKKTCVVGMGNVLRGDDGVGARIAERLMETPPLPAGLTVVNAEDVLESWVFPIAESDSANVLLVDAVRGAGAPPGSLVLGKVDEIEAPASDFSTHKLALSTAAGVLAGHGKTVYLLGIVPASTDYGDPMSDEAMESADAVVDWIRTARSRT